MKIITIKNSNKFAEQTDPDKHILLYKHTFISDKICSDADTVTIHAPHSWTVSGSPINRLINISSLFFYFKIGSVDPKGRKKNIINKILLFKYFRRLRKRQCRKNRFVPDPVGML